MYMQQMGGPMQNSYMPSESIIMTQPQPVFGGVPLPSNNAGQQVQHFRPLLTLSSLDIKSEEGSCTYRCCTDMGCVKCAWMCCIKVKKPLEIPITIDVLPGARPETSLLRINHVYPTTKYSVAKFLKDVCCECELDWKELRFCSMCFEAKSEASYTFLLGDVSAVSSQNNVNKCKPCCHVCCCLWCYPDDERREVEVHMQKSAGGQSVVYMGWRGAKVPEISPYYNFLLDKENPALTLQNLIIYLRTELGFAGLSAPVSGGPGNNGAGESCA